MKNHWRSLASFLLIFAMLLTMLPTAAWAGWTAIRDDEVRPISQGEEAPEPEEPKPEKAVDQTAQTRSATPPATLPGFKQVTSVEELVADKRYLIVSQDENGGLYALRANAPETGGTAGNLTSTTADPLYAAALTVGENTLTAHMVAAGDTLTEPKTETAEVELDALLFTVGEGTATNTYTVYNEKSGLHLVLPEKGQVFQNTAGNLNITVDSSGVFTVSIGRRVLDFNKSGDSRQFGTYGTDFWTPRSAKFPLYFYIEADKGAFTEALTEALAEAKALVGAEYKYTPESLQALQTAITAAQAVIDNPSASEGKVTEALTTLQAAVDALARRAPTIAGYELATSLDAAADGYYLIVAAVEKTGATADEFYALYPGATGGVAGNAKKLTVADGAATGLADGATWAQAENLLQKKGNTYSVTAASTAEADTTYYLFHGTEVVYFTEGSSTVTMEKADGNYMRLHNSAGSYLLYWDTNACFSQAKGLGNAAYHPDILLYRSTTRTPPAVEQGQHISLMLGSEKDNTWVFTGSRAAQGSFQDIAGARSMMGQFEEYIRNSLGGGTNQPGQQRHTVSTAYAGQTLAQINTDWSRITEQHPRAVVYLADTQDFANTDTATMDAFKAELRTFITASLVLRGGALGTDEEGILSFAVIMRPYATGSNAAAVTAVNAAIDAVVGEAAFQGDHVKSHIAVVESVDLSASGLLSEHDYPSAKGHLELAKALAKTVNGSVPERFPTTSTSFSNIEANFPNDNAVSAESDAWVDYTSNISGAALASARQAIKNKMDSGAVTWLFMGDSITHGAGWLYGYDSIAQSFEKFLKDDLGRNKDVVINTGDSGARTDTTVQNIQYRLKNYHPDVVSIMLGTNDAGNQVVSVDNYKSNLNTILETIKNSTDGVNPNAIILLRTPTPTAAGNRGEHISKYVAAMKAVAAESAYTNDIIVVDQFSAWDPLMMRTGTTPSYLYTQIFDKDTGMKIHPGPVGHMWMTHQFIEAAGLWDDNAEICNLGYAVNYGAAENSTVTPTITHTETSITLDLATLSTQTGAAILAAEVTATPAGAAALPTVRGYRGGTAAVDLTGRSEREYSVSVKALADFSGTGKVLTFPAVTVDLDEAGTGELTIPGYTQVKELSEITDGYYLVVAPFEKDNTTSYYVLYPGGTGGGDADTPANNLRKLTVDANLRATGLTDFDGGAVTAGNTFESLDNAFRKKSGSNVYEITAQGSGDTQYSLVLQTGANQVYQTSGTSSITLAKSGEGFTLHGARYLIVYTDWKCFSQWSTLNTLAAEKGVGEMLLFRHDGKELPTEPVDPTPTAVAVENALKPNYTLLTHAKFDADGGLDEGNYYIFVSKDSEGNYFALYPAAGAKGVSAGNLGTAGLRTAAITTNGTTSSAKYLKDNSALALTQLQFTTEKSGGGYLFTGATGLKMDMSTPMFSDTANVLGVDKRADVTDAFYVHNGTSRYLNFNKNGDDASGNFSGNVTDFWGPNDAAKDHFPIYIFYKPGAPTAWQNLQALLTEIEEANLVEREYTKATWRRFSEALAAAKALTASSPNQDIRSALTALREAYEGLQAAPVVPDEPTAKVYTLDTDGLDSGEKYAIFVPNPLDGGNTRLMHNSGTATNQCGATLADETHVNLGGCGDEHLWVVSASGNGYTIQGVSSPVYLTSANSGGQLALSSTAEVFTVEKSGNGYYLKNAAGKYVSFGPKWHMADTPFLLQFFKEEIVPVGEDQMVRNWKDLVPASQTTQEQPFRAGTAGSGHFRIPSMVTLTKGSHAGRLVAAIDARWNHNGDACSLDTILSYSDDNGANWTYLFPNYFGDTTDAKDPYGTAFIDPVMTETSDGTLYLMVDLYPGGVAINTAPMAPACASGYVEINGVKRLVVYTTGVTSEQSDDNYSYYVGDFSGGYAPILDVSDNSESGFYVDDHYYIYYQRGTAADHEADKIFCQQLGSNKFIQQNLFFYNASLHVRNASYLWIVTSKDGGVTWSSPIMVNDQVRTGVDKFYGVGPGRGVTVTLPSGKERIILPCYTFSTERSSVIYSDDGGKTWTRSPSMTSGSSESAPVMVGDTLYLFTRYGGYYTSADYGETWSNKKTMPMSYWTSCQISAIHHSWQVDGKEIILLSVPASSSGRNNGKIFALQVNDDADKSLTLLNSYTVTQPGAAFAYSCMTELTKANDNGKVGDVAILYEGGSHPATFKVVPYEDIIPRLTATGYSGEYDGRPHSIDVTLLGGQNLTLQYSTDQTTWGAVAPTYTDVGTYTVYYRAQGVDYLHGSAVVEIVPASQAPEITLTADVAAITGDGSALLTVSGIPEGRGTLTVVDDYDPATPLELGGPYADGSYTARVTLHASGVDEAHTYTATYADPNYAQDAIATCSVMVHPLDVGTRFAVTAKGFNGPYDGMSHTITVNVTPVGEDPLPDGIVISYSESEAGPYTATAPTRTNAGTTVVYYKVTDGAHTITGSATILIGRVNPDMAINGPHTYVYDVEHPLTFTVTGVPTADQGTFFLGSSDHEIQNKSFVTEGDTLTYTAQPHLPEETRTYTFVAVFEPNENSNYNRYVRTLVTAVTLKEPDPLDFGFVSGVSVSPEEPFHGYITVPFDGEAHSVSEYLRFEAHTVSVRYAEEDGSEEPVYSEEAPSYTRAGEYTVYCMGSDKNGELDSILLTLTLTITEGTVKPDLHLTADPTTLQGGGQVKLTVTGAPTEGTVTLTCDDPSITIPEPGWDGSYTVTLPETEKTYIFTATYTPEPGTPYESATDSCAVMVTEEEESGGGGGSVVIIGGGAGGGSGSTKPEGTENPDGSVTFTTTDPATGAVTERTEYVDGTVTVVETEKDGTVTTTTTTPNGVEVETVQEPGEDVTAAVTIPANVPEATVTIPAEIDYSTVVIDADTGEIIQLAVPNETLSEMQLKLGSSANLILVQQPNGFEDVEGHWAEDAIDFTSAHQLFQGTSETTFSPNDAMNRAMLVTILARMDGVDTAAGATWYEAGAQWAKDNGISDAANLNGDVSREQLATMLWRYAGCPVTTGDLSEFADAGEVSSYARMAMRWAVKQGIFQGSGSGNLEALRTASRGEVSTVMLRFYRYMVR